MTYYVPTVCAHWVELLKATTSGPHQFYTFAMIQATSIDLRVEI